MEKRRNDTLEVKRLSVQSPNEAGKLKHITDTILLIVETYNKINGDLMEFDKDAQGRLADYAVSQEQVDMEQARPRQGLGTVRRTVIITSTLNCSAQTSPAECLDQSDSM